MADMDASQARPEGQLSTSEVELYKHRLRTLHTQRMAFTDALVRIDGEVNVIQMALQASAMLTVTPRRIVARRCTVCSKLTTDRFADIPQCAKHVAGGDAWAARALEDLLYGP